LGGYRLFLALLVVLQHLAGVQNIGGYAVFGFYMISGYLMTLVVQHVYKYSIPGFLRYALNRFLRIYPSYWVSVGFSLFLLYCLGSDFFSAYRRTIDIPEDAAAWLRNIFIFFPERESPRLTPPSWALTVEIFFYIAIGLSLSRSRKITQVWFLGSALYHIVALVLNFGDESRYFPIWAASLPFSTGALAYHFRGELKRMFSGVPFLASPFAAVVLGALFFANWWVGLKFGLSGGFSFYVNYFLCFLALAGFAFVWPGREGGIDDFLGALSYPVYLLHYQVGAVVIVIFDVVGLEVRRGQFLLFVLSVPFVLLAAYLMVVVVERPIDRVRLAVRSALVK
jgi:peptidoglycan/LPS O-acetylase OafA/YrhL